jgi:hypothetical protein
MCRNWHPSVSGCCVLRSGEFMLVFNLNAYIHCVGF